MSEQNTHVPFCSENLSNTGLESYRAAVLHWVVQMAIPWREVPDRSPPSPHYISLTAYVPCAKGNQPTCLLEEDNMLFIACCMHV